VRKERETIRQKTSEDAQKTNVFNPKSIKNTLGAEEVKPGIRNYFDRARITFDVENRYQWARWSNTPGML
jgi:hypothetical protein